MGYLLAAKYLAFEGTRNKSLPIELREECQQTSSANPEYTKIIKNRKSLSLKALMCYSKEKARYDKGKNS
jgi:hypothetical protein